MPYADTATSETYAAPVVVAPVVADPAPASAASAPAAPAGENSYRVERGDTLGAIAARHGTTVAALMQINNLSDPNFIYVGQRIRLS
jgi:LysM repeat protein